MILGSMEDIMRYAIKKAEEGVSDGQTPFGAVIAQKLENGSFRVLAAEHNRVWCDTDITAHAEVNAIRSACKKLGSVKLTGCVIASTTEPCPMCFAAIHWAGLDEVYFGASISDSQSVGFGELTISNDKMAEFGHSDVKVHGGVLSDECRKLLSEWGTKVDKKPY